VSWLCNVAEKPHHVELDGVEGLETSALARPGARDDEEPSG
jgi:hypothetical protein